MPGRTALITGGSSGIGLAIARALAEDGFGLTLAARDAERLTAAAAELEGTGVAVETVVADVTREEDLRRLAAAHRRAHGRLDVLVNNAGGGVRGELAETSAAALDHVLAVNVRAPYLLTRECLPMLRAAGAEHGRALVVNVSSMAAKHPRPSISAYSAAKAALVGFSDAARAELAADGVRVTVLCPAYVATPMARGIEGVPRGEMLAPEDLAEAVRFLLEVSPACVVPELVLDRPGADPY